MAPKYGNVVITVLASICDFSQSPVDLWQLIIDCIFLVVVIVIAWFWFRVIKRAPGPKVSQIFPWYCFEIALFWALVSYILAIIFEFTFYCSDTSPFALGGVWIGSFLTGSITDLLVLGIILLCLTPYVLKRANQVTKVANYVNASIMAVVVALFVPFVIITSIVNYSSFISDDSYLQPITTSALDIAAAYYLLLLCAAVCGAIVLFSSVGILGEANTLNTSIKRWTIFTMTSLILQRLFVVIVTFVWFLPNSPIIPNSAAIAFFALISATSAGSFFGAARTIW